MSQNQNQSPQATQERQALSLLSNYVNGSIFFVGANGGIEAKGADGQPIPPLDYVCALRDAIDVLANAVEEAERCDCEDEAPVVAG